MITISNVPDEDGFQRDVSIDRIPDRCPVCHNGIEPIKQNLAYFRENDRRLEIVFRCPRRNCQTLFIGRYGPGFSSSGLFYRGSVPLEPVGTKYSEHITKISPKFCAIANQAQKAEAQDWKLIAGPGYRKALEFLIKDYLCAACPENAEKIRKELLGSCISEYVTNDKVKATAARAAWLGNDETHYVRKWEDKDLEDLKKLIVLTVHWIEMELMTSTILQEMPDGRS